MKHVRGVLVAFAILDAILLGRFAGAIGLPEFVPGAPRWFTASEIVRPLFLISLAFSAYGLACERRWGFVLSYSQFPLRIAFMLLSFGFLTLVPWFIPDSGSVMPVMVVAIVLECGRLAVTIVIHVKRAKGRSGPESPIARPYR